MLHEICTPRETYVLSLLQLPMSYNHYRKKNKKGLNKARSGRPSEVDLGV
jgi:hypothetical protein